jgi:uncharacterized protein
MKLDLRDIIEIPGGSVSFAQELDVSRLDFPQVARYVTAPRAEGVVRNTAGVLRATGTVTADMICICDRCGAQFNSCKETPVDALVVSTDEPDDPAAFRLEGDALDLDEVLETALVLDMETKFLCSEDCRGICPTCGKNLNEGPCSCRKELDPRLAVLEQLLDK